MEWERPDFGELEVSPAFGSDETLFLAGYDGLFVTTDGCRSWRQIETLTPRAITGLGISPDFRVDGSLGVAT